MFSSLSEDSILCEAAAKFLSGDAYRFQPTTGGVNNVVRYIEDNQGNKYILRVYNNGNDSKRVRFEHAILAQLQDAKLSFRIPTTVPCVENGKSHVMLSNGAEASLFHVIPGQLPKLTLVREIGFASGELNAALAQVHLDMESPNPPYYELYRVHHAVTREGFFEVLASSDFDAFRSATTELANEILALESLIERLLALQLPTQLIHGDLHYDNVLVHDNEVSGLLDFEFCAMDWRAMELAICLSKYAGEKAALDYFDTFIEGYMQKAELTPLEMTVIPDLINLRILSNVVYFVGRSIAKEDSIATLTCRVETYLARIKWINANRENITSRIEKAVASRVL